MKYDVLLWNCPPGRLSGCGAVSGFTTADATTASTATAATAAGRLG